MWRAANIFNGKGIWREERQKRDKIGDFEYFALGSSGHFTRHFNPWRRHRERARVVLLSLACSRSGKEREKELQFFFSFFFPSFNNSSRRSRPRARALKIKAVIIEFPFPRRADYFCHIAPGEEKGREVERIDIISCTLNWSVCEKCKNFSMTTRAFVNISRWRKIALAFVRISTIVAIK